MSENNKNTQNTSNNPEKKKNRGLVAVILALIVIIIILLLRSCGTGDLPNPDGPGGNNGPVFDLDIDSGAQEGKPEGRPIEEIQEELEGCLSLPGLWFSLQRSSFARAEGIDLDGKKVIVEGKGLMARMIQHECDHLDGHLFTDRLEGKERARAQKAIRNI